MVESSRRLARLDSLFPHRRYVGTILWIAYLVVPARTLGLIHGLPLDPFDAFGLLAVGWLTFQGVHLGGARVTGSALAVMLLMPAVVPVTKGFRARYFANAEAHAPFERSTDYPDSAFTRVDDRLDFSPGRSEFPLYFFSDVARIDSRDSGGNDLDPFKRPFAVEWDGYWRIEERLTRTIFVDAPGASAEVIIDTASVLKVGPTDGLQLAPVPLTPGSHRLLIHFSSPYEGPRRFSAGERVGNQPAPFDAAEVTVRKHELWQLRLLRSVHLVKGGFDALLFAWLGVLVARAIRKAYQRFHRAAGLVTRKRAALTLFAIASAAEACIFAAPFAGRPWLLTTGSKALVYESWSRQIRLNGPLLSVHDGLIGQSGSFRYEVLYPYFLASAHWLFGESMFGVMLVQRLLVAFAVWALAEIAERIGGERVWPAAFACAIVFVYAGYAPVAAGLASESLFVPLLVGCSAWLLRAWRRPHGRPPGDAGIPGRAAAPASALKLRGWPERIARRFIPEWRPRPWVVRTLDLLLPVAICVYTFAIRTQGITDHFMMLADQIRDWTLALGPFASLPRVGPASVGGGHSFGPIFYWVLWLSRVTLGPFMDNLPHAGGFGLAATQSIADVVLFAGIWRASGSRVFAAAAVLLIASAPFDLALSASAWNPVLAAALAKTAAGLVLQWQSELTRGRRVVLFALAWLAVQSHSPAMPFSIAIVLWVLGAQWRLGVRQGARSILEAALVVIVLQIPSFFAAEDVQPGIVLYFVGHPQLRLSDSLRAVSDAIQVIGFAPWTLADMTLLLFGAAAIVLIARGPFCALVAVTVLPIVIAVAMWALWQAKYDAYWFLTLVPPAILLVLWPARMLPGRQLRPAAAGVLLAFALYAQAPRRANAEQIARLPGYGAIVKGSRALIRRGETIRGIDAPFLPPSSDPEFVYRILHGRIDHGAPRAARVAVDGNVSYFTP